jgi:epoxyqueuosine reductase
MDVARNEQTDFSLLALRIKAWGHELGFQQIGIANTDLSEAEARLLDWLDCGMHGEMQYMAAH